MMPVSSSVAVAPDDRDLSESLYDEYLDACRAGEAENPEAFFARHPELSETGRDRIRTLAGVLAEARPDVRPPWERLGQYRLLRRIGGGAMGEVYLGEQESLRRLVALKVVRPELGASPTALARFTREATAIAKLSHPNVVRILELGEDGPVRYLAMEFVPGRSLSELLAGERPHPARVLRWGEQLARALHEAHGRGVVHRDVKPGNVLVTPDDQAVLLDFGVARLAEASTKLTKSFAGSPSYAAPEQISGREVDARTDVYGLGATLYEALTGKLPFTGSTVEEIFARILRGDPVPPRRLAPDLRPDVETVVLTAMANRPTDRYATAAEFARDLAALAAGERIRARPPHPVQRLLARARAHPALSAGIAAGLVALLAFAAVLFVQADLQVRERRTTAAGLVASASARVEARRADRIATAARRTRHEALTMKLGDSWLTDEEDRELAELDAAVAEARRRRETSFYEILDELRAAERLDPEVAGADAVRARLYLERMEEAQEAEEFEEAALYRELAERHDPDGAVTGALHRPAHLAVTTDPPGAELHLFREEALPEGRFVPVPHRGTPPPEFPEGGFALRVVRDASGVPAGSLILRLAGHEIRGAVLAAADSGDVRRGDRLVAVDGTAVRSIGFAELHRDGVRFEFERDGIRFVHEGPPPPLGTPADVAADGGLPALVWRDGRVEEVVLPAGLSVRTTAAPLFAGAASLLGTSPVAETTLEPGRYRILVRPAGGPEIVVPLALAPGGRLEWNLSLPAEGEIPEGFVYVPRAPGGHAPFLLMEREVTCAEYLEFLNDPATQAEIAAADRLIRAPRDAENAIRGGTWTRTADGRWRLPDSWRADWPVMGVSYEDAVAYAAWRSRRDGAECFLPNREQWTRATAAEWERVYLFGDVWRPRWVKSCFSLPQARPEPGMRYPIDEAFCGAFDMTGGVSEWIDDVFDPARGFRRLAGSSWAHADPDLFRVWGGVGAAPDVSAHTFGFRLARKWERP